MVGSLKKWYHENWGTVVSCSQLQKMSDEILLIVVLLMSTFVRFKQFEKHPEPIRLTVDGNVILRIDVPEKARS